MFDSLVQFIQTMGPDSLASGMLLETFPLAKIMSVDDCAYNNRGPWWNISLGPSWNNRTDLDDYARKWCHDLVAQLAELEKEDHSVSEDQHVVGTKGYFNGSLGDEKLSWVFGDKLPRLRELKRKYDPEFVFKKWFPIPPAEK